MTEVGFRAMFEQAAVGVAELDLRTGRFFEVNQRYCDLVGYTRDEMLAMDVWSITHPDDQAANRVDVRLLQSGETRERCVEKRYLHKSGKVIWARVTIAALSPAGILPEHVVTVVEDITASRATEKALRASEEKWRRVFEALPFGISLLRDGAIVEFNPAVAKVLAFTDEERKNRSVQARTFVRADGTPLPHDEWPSVRAVRDQVAVEAIEVGVAMPDGRARWTEVSAVPLQLPDSDCVVVTSDITARKAAEAEALRLAGELQHAMKLQAVGRLAGGVAHDFNNMLTVILGSVEVAMEHLPPTHPVREDLLEIKRAATRSAELTRQLLTFARKQPVAARAIDLNAAVTGTLKMLRRMIRESVELRWIPGASLDLIFVDPSQLDQILVNLCVNAREAIANVGTVAIETANVTLETRDCVAQPDRVPGPYVRLAVIDDGTGMDAETLHYIFEPFFTTKPAGTGLGLSTVFGIVTQNGGHIRVASKPGRGTTFEIFFPRHAGDLDEATRERDASATRGAATILLVDDEPAILGVMARALATRGHVVLTAQGPHEALALASQRDDIELLITDVVMPGMNGRDLADLLAARVPMLKRLFMSGYTHEVLQGQTSIHLLEKPFSVAALLAKVDELLRN